MKFETKAIHTGQEPDPVTGAVIPPLYQTTTFVQEAPGVHKGYDYSRAGNPTRTVLEEVLADLENGKHGFAFASGSGALTTLCLAFFETGDHLIVGDDVYGGTYRFLTRVLQKFGVTVDYVDMTDPENVRKALRPETKLIHLETPTNPLLKLVDLAAVVEIAKGHGIPSCVDNTFASPYLQQPFSFGADIILHSTTKYIGGHSDVVGGALILRDDTYEEKVRFHQNAVGATPDPFASWLTLRGLKTLAVRMEAHSRSAATLASWLEAHANVESVIYPGLESHPQHELAKTQMKAFGGMISFRIKGDADATSAFLKKLKLFKLAESLGGVESLVEIPAIMTHASIDASVREALGITNNLARLSVGIENVEDLQNDLEQALGNTSIQQVA